jgi:3-oxoadipate enol-lactonase
MTRDHLPSAPYSRVDGPPDAPVLVLGPSLGTDLRLFDAQVTALAGGYRIIRFDLPGHGRTPAPAGPYSILGMARDVVALLDGRGIGRFHYVGVSIGGAIGQQLAVAHPERLLSLTVCASAARFADPESWPQRAATVRAHGTEAMLASRPGTWFTQRFLDTHPREAERLLDMLRATTAEGYAGCCEAIATFDLRDRLHTITVPTLAIAGGEDPATPPEMVRRIAEGVRHGRFVVIDDAAHLVNVERPDQVNAALREHLASVAERGDFVTGPHTS